MLPVALEAIVVEGVELVPELSSVKSTTSLVSPPLVPTADPQAVETLPPYVI